MSENKNEMYVYVNFDREIYTDNTSYSEEIKLTTKVREITYNTQPIILHFAATMGSRSKRQLFKTRYEG